MGLHGGGGEGGESSRRGSDGLGDSVPDARRQCALRGGTAELEHKEDKCLYLRVRRRRQATATIETWSRGGRSSRQ